MQIGDSWLLPRGGDRERMLDMDARLQPIRRKTFGVLGIGLLACSPWIGLWPIAPWCLAIGMFALAQRIVRHSPNPGTVMFAAWACAPLIIASSVALTGRLRESTVYWVAIPITTLSARFSTRGVWVGVTLSVAFMAAVLLGTDASAVLRVPPILLAPVVVVVANAMLSTALMRSDIEHRRETLIDPLTGMLNRNALDRRVEVLAQQSQVSGDLVGVIIADVDNFKAVNDSRGHAIGDAVLKDVAYVLRKSGRAFEWAHRCGGDEFVILVPGANLAQCHRHAEGMRESVEREVLTDGQRVTMSFGVAASKRGTRFDYAALYTLADIALYNAKRSGRNCVCTSGLGTTPAGAARQRAWREAAMSTPRSS